MTIPPGRGAALSSSWRVWHCVAAVVRHRVVAVVALGALRSLMSGAGACLPGSRRGWLGRGRTATRLMEKRAAKSMAERFGISRGGSCIATHLAYPRNSRRTVRKHQTSRRLNRSQMERMARRATLQRQRGCCCGEPWAKENDYCHATTTASRRGSTPARGRNSRWIPCHEVQVQGSAMRTGNRRRRRRAWKGLRTWP